MSLVIAGMVIGAFIIGFVISKLYYDWDRERKKRWKYEIDR